MNTYKVIRDVIFAIMVGALVFMSYHTALKDVQEKKAQELALENCFLYGEWFTQAVVLDGKSYCIASKDEVIVPLNFLIDNFAPEGE